MSPTRMQIDRILCPVDFSEFSAPALERAIQLGKWFEARVEVFHVVPFLVPAGVGLPYFPAPPEVTGSLREQAELEVAKLVEPLLGEGVAIETKVVEGEPWRVIEQEAAALPADLLVMGTHGRGGLEHLLLGSVTEKVLRRTSCPVLTVGHVPAHARPGSLFRRILCAADLTRASDHTLDVAVSMASENGARITLLHVVESLPGENAAHFLAGPEMGHLRRELVEQAHTQLKQAINELGADFCEIRERVATGAPWSEILRAADEMDADLIVMGAHTRGAVGRMFFGSTSSHVVRRAVCPVLVVQEIKKAGPPKRAADARRVLSA
jgi:nucleotide-binding universal stress UspA family protein